MNADRHNLTKLNLPIDDVNKFMYYKLVQAHRSWAQFLR